MSSIQNTQQTIDDGNQTQNQQGQKRKSRFVSVEDEPQTKRVPVAEASVDISAAAARAAQISKELSNKIAMVSSLLKNVNDDKGGDRKAMYRPLLLDAQGREIDESGNLVKQDGIVRTLAANLAVAKEVKKKVNPYLMHKDKSILSDGANGTEGLVESSEIMDERLPMPGSSRDLRGKKALTFVEEGKYVKEADKIKLKEERKIIAGYTSGRKNLQQLASDVGADSTVNDESNPVEMDTEMTIPSSSNKNNIMVPPPLDVVVPSLEWWDEIFLPKELRENRKRSKATFELDPFESLSYSNSKTLKYIQHPVPVKPLGATTDKGEVPLPMFLTKKERKKLRKSTRAAREQEKRDKLMMGLIPAPEPKFKLSNFMKILGDQAVADPSKVELRVLQQMQQRVLNHEMRNQAAKLTPKERKEKKIRKLTEDTSKSVNVAVFNIADFSNLKHRFKVDVNAQQLFLSGI
eukprot:gene14609-19618_t